MASSTGRLVTPDAASYTIKSRESLVEQDGSTGHFAHERARKVEGRSLNPWGNRLEIVKYANSQFTKAPSVLRGMGLSLDKNEKARRELADKGMAEDPGR